MAINIKFDLVGNPEPPTIILATRNGNKLGQLDIDENSIELKDKLNDACEFTFTMHKKESDFIKKESEDDILVSSDDFILQDSNETYLVSKDVDNNTSISDFSLWDKVTNFKLVYCKEWDKWFEITVELDEETETVKTVFCTQLGQAELSQLMLYNVEINTEQDIARDDYKISILWDASKPEASILHRLLKDKAPHYKVIHVDPTVAKIQRMFSFDDTSIYDAFQEIGEEIGCLFDFPSNSDENGKIQRTIAVYDLEANCKDCGHRGVFTGVCPECGSKDITEGYGDDTLIFVTADELAEDISLATDTDAVKNCFKLEAGDDLMTATVRNCNPNGTDYLWHISDTTKSDMSDELVEKLEEYNELYEYYQKDYAAFSGEIPLSKHESKEFIIGEDIQVGDILKFTCKTDEIDKVNITYTFAGLGWTSIFTIQKSDGEYSSSELVISGAIESVYTNEYTEVSLSKSSEEELKDVMTEYNNLVTKYQEYNKDLQIITTPIIGYPALMQAYYNTIDLELYLKSSLVPTVKMSDTNAKLEADKLISGNLQTVSTENIEYISEATADNIVLSMAKILVDSRYKVQIDDSSFDKNTNYWSGIFKVTNYSDEEDTALSPIVNVEIKDDYGDFVQQKIEKMLNKENTDDYSISGLFKKNIIANEIVDENGDSTGKYAYTGEFAEELKKYSLNCLTSFHNACQSCIDILIEQGIGNKDTWSKQNPNLYEDLYLPYLYKLGSIEYETKIRQYEINIITGIYDINDELKTYGLQNHLEDIQDFIHDELNFEKYLGEELWFEFCSFRREDKYTNDNYISDGLNNLELFDNAFKFIEAAQKEIYKSAELQHSISSTLKNLLAIEKFKPLINSFKVGNWLRILIDEEIYKLRLIEYSIDYGDFESISVKFSDVIKHNAPIDSIQGVIEQASKMATSYDSVQKQAELGQKSNSIIGGWSLNGMDVTNTKIIQGADNQTQTWDEHGMLFKKYDEVSDTYDDTQLKIVNSTMAITDDNWKTVKTAVGKYYYFDPSDNNKLKEAYGINAEVLVGKLILGEQLGIYNETGSLTFDSDGFEITNGVNSFKVNPDADMLLSISNMVMNEKTGELEEKKVFFVDKTGGLYIDGSGVDINADHVVFTSFKDDLKNGVTEISGGCIITNTLNGNSIISNSITAEQIDATNLKVDAANITGKLTIGQVEDLEIPTKVGDLENDIGYLTESGVTTIVGGVVTTDYVNALGITVDAANISGVLNANQINMSGAITWNDLSASLQDDLDELGDGLTVAEVKTMITDELVSSPNIQGANYWSSDENTWMNLLNTEETTLGIGGGIEIISANTHIFSAIRDTYLAVMFKAYNTNFLQVTSTGAVQPRGNWDFQFAEVDGINGSGGTATAVFG